ncbi:MAG: hypothetical protein A2583_00570 [Bdellovibrionales bacterium RIFOXYD1_FULL_53_11]|nr:MAG: hypothetical protein A2583_00570 [Bdellovibrionales bacterium RIFOXYD1_FULL_53_11]
MKKMFYILLVVSLFSGVAFAEGETKTTGIQSSFACPLAAQRAKAVRGQQVSAGGNQTGTAGSTEEQKPPPRQ